MSDRHPPSRRHVKADLLFLFLAVVLVALMARLGVLIESCRQRAEQSSAVQERTAFSLPARPGHILAVAGKRYVPLAASRQMPSCFADPSLIADQAQRVQVAREVAAALGVNELDIYHKLLERRDKRFVWLARRVQPARARAVGALGLRCVGIQHEWQRVYPLGDLAAPVVGFRRRADNVAGAGLELAVDDTVRAEPGKRVCIADAGRRGIWPVAAESTAPRDGRHVLLFLDATIQDYLQEAVADAQQRDKAQWAAGVVVCPQSGAVLALASCPSYNPNAYWKADAADRTNRAISLPYEPGSVAKPLFAAYAASEGVLSWQSRIDCENGTYYADGGGRIGDHGHSYGLLTVSDIIKYSSNIGMAKIGEMLGNARLHAAALEMGFGRETGLGLPGESPGQLRPLRRWDGYSMRRVPFGQEISVTSLQLAMAYAALANDGRLLRPRLVDRVIGPDGENVWQSEPEVVARPFSPAAARGAIEAMQRVVEEEGGTGRRARMTYWTCAGKTGTAQVAGRGGYQDGQYVGSFVGIAPVAQPRLVCLISVYRPDPAEGYYGGVVAAPGVREVLRRALAYLDVPPGKLTHLAAAGR